jgi:hypothetical protein
MEKEPPSAKLARLESVVLIGDTHHATFRMAGGPVTVGEGGWLGEQRVGTVGRSSVTLVSRAGETRAVRLGTETPIE